VGKAASPIGKALFSFGDEERFPVKDRASRFLLAVRKIKRTKDPPPASFWVVSARALFLPPSEEIIEELPSFFNIAPAFNEAEINP